MAHVNGVKEGLNEPERILQSIPKFNTFTKSLFSDNLSADVPKNEPHALHAGILGDLASQATRIPEDIEDILLFLDTLRHRGLLDDRKHLLENVIKLAASLPSDSPFLRTLTSKFTDSLWKGLNHPPLSYLGDEWKYRTADGSNNNKTMPWLGKAPSPYARTVTPRIQLPPTLPDPGLIFDELYARRETAREHPNEVSSMLFYLATIIIHDIFRTDEKDWNVMANSSYLDLSPLYGNSDQTQRQVRTMKDGKLKPDAFSDKRLHGFPPGVAALLCSFNRFHNYVATQLAEVNEDGRFTLDYHWDDYKEGKYGTPEQKRDNDLFNTARLVTCGLYINVILNDYVRTILNLNASDTEWTLDPRQDPQNIYGPSGIPEGIGNQVSVEFNLVYRWHSAISIKDEKWTNQFFEKLLPGTDWKTLGMSDLPKVLGSLKGFLDGIPFDPGMRTFAGLRRQPDGAFKDEDLVNLLKESTEDCGGGFGARNVPVVMKIIDMLGIAQARKWNVATLNEFRQFFGMQPHKSFSDISSQKDVAASLKTLYGSPDLVELYPGLVAEDAKEVMDPGAGLCPGFTIAKAILSDAVALVRGDRFYTVDYNATTLTNWGFNAASSNPQIAGGGVMYKLLHRAFPGWYQGDSVYAMFPMQTPQKMKDVLEKRGQAKNFSFEPPSKTPSWTVIKTWKAVTETLENHDEFKVTWGHNTYDAIHHDFMLSGDKQWNFDQHTFIGAALYPKNSEWKKDIRAMYHDITMELIKEKSHRLTTGHQLDVVKDLGNLSHALASGRIFHMPLKTVEHHVGFLTPLQYYTMMSVLFAYVFLDFDDGKAFELRQGALQSTAAIKKITEGVVELVQKAEWSTLASWFWKATGVTHEAADLEGSYGTKLIKRMTGHEDGSSPSDVAAAMICTMSAAVCTQAQGFAQVVDLLMQDKYKHHWDEIRSLARSNSDDANEKLEKYALECLRLATPAFGVLRDVEADSATIDDGPNGMFKLSKGDRVFLDFVSCGRDPAVFPDPEDIKLDRDAKLYIHHGYGKHTCLGRDLVTTALATQLKCLARCKNLRRSPGPQGELKYTKPGLFKVYMKEDWSDSWPFPTTMKFLHDRVEDW